CHGAFRCLCPRRPRLVQRPFTPRHVTRLLVAARGFPRDPCLAMGCRGHTWAMDSDRIVIRRAAPLHGTVVVPGAKNSVLKLMAATLLADGTYRLSNVPAIADVAIMSDLLTAIGVTTEFAGDGSITMKNGGDLTPVAQYELGAQTQASINVLGPLLGRCGRVTLSLPGGDDFGSRPI